MVQHGWLTIFAATRHRIQSGQGELCSTGLAQMNHQGCFGVEVLLGCRGVWCQQSLVGQAQG